MTDWDAIVANHSSAVWGTLWRLLGERADVEECFQETFLAALALSRRQTVESWAAALSSLATARAIDRLRQRYRQRDRWRPHGGTAESENTSVSTAVSTDAGPVEHAVAAELSERLREALVQLPERQAEVFSLHVFDGWTHRELAERMRLTENAVGVMLHRARQRLKELLHESG